MDQLLPDCCYTGLMSNNLLSQLFEDISDTAVLDHEYSYATHDSFLTRTPYLSSGVMAKKSEHRDTKTNLKSEKDNSTLPSPSPPSSENTPVFMATGTVPSKQIPGNPHPSRRGVSQESEKMPPIPKIMSAPLLEAQHISSTKKRQLSSRRKRNRQSGRRNNSEKTPQRLPHKQIERKYRERLNAGLEQLRQAVPTLSMGSTSEVIGGPRISKTRVLSAAIDYIRQVEYERDRLLYEMHNLQSISG